MKIAIFSDCYLDLTGGIRTSIDAQKAALENLGHTVYIFSTGFPKTNKALQKLAEQNIFQVPSCKWCFRGLTPVSRRPKIVEKWLIKDHPEIQDFDVFYVHYESGCSIAGLRLAKKLKIPSVQVMHGREDMGETNIVPFGFRTLVAVFLNWFHSWYLPHSKTIHRDGYLANSFAKAKMWTLMVNHANFADLVLTPSQHFCDKLKYYGVKKPIRVFSNGYPDDRFPKDPQVKTLAPGAELKIIWHSRVSGEKRIMPFLEGLAQVKGKFRLDVYGNGGDYLRAQRFAKKHGIKVKFHGDTPFSKVQLAILDSHLDVLASYNFDTFGMTLIEAEAAGVPAFFCDPDMKEVVPPGSYVLSVSPSPNDMAKAIDDLISRPEKIQAMSRVMLDHRKEVLISRRIKLLEQIFSDIIKS